MGRILFAALIVLLFDLVGPVQNAATAALRGGPACLMHPEYGNVLGNQLSGYPCFFYVFYRNVLNAKPTPLLIRPIYPMLQSSMGWTVLQVFLFFLAAGVGIVVVILLKMRGHELLEAVGVANYHSEELKRLS